MLLNENIDEINESGVERDGLGWRCQLGQEDGWRALRENRRGFRRDKCAGGRIGDCRSRPQTNPADRV